MPSKSQIGPRRRLPRSLKLLALAAVGALLATGCARSVITTSVRADGNWTRTVSFHGPNPDKNGLGPNTKLEDVFTLPAGGSWKITQSKTDEEVVYTAERPLHLGDVVRQDISVKGKKEVVLTNEASVKETSPGVFTYREVLHWQGPMPKDLTDPEVVAGVKAALPPALATDANVKKTSEELGRELGMTLMGPPDPLLPHILSGLMMQPDLVQHQISNRLGDSVDKILAADYGDRLTPEQRHEVIRKLISGVFSTTQSKFKSKTKMDAGNNNND